MIVDTSAVVAILLREPGHERLVTALAAETRAGIGAPTLVEAGIVLSHRLGFDARGLLARFRESAGIEVVPFGDAHAAAAVDAWLRFGKGRHPAARPPRCQSVIPWTRSDRGKAGRTGKLHVGNPFGGVLMPRSY